MTGLWTVKHLLNWMWEYQLLLQKPSQSGCTRTEGTSVLLLQTISYFPWTCCFQEIRIQQLETTRSEKPCVRVVFSWNDWRCFGREKWECLVCMNVSKSESASPRFVLLKALQFIPLLGQGWLQVQIGAIVRELQRAVIELWKRIEWNKRLNESNKQKVTPWQN